MTLARALLLTLFLASLSLAQTRRWTVASVSYGGGSGAGNTGGSGAGGGVADDWADGGLEWHAPTVVWVPGPTAGEVEAPSVTQFRQAWGEQVLVFTDAGFVTSFPAEQFSTQPVVADVANFIPCAAWWKRQLPPFTSGGAQLPLLDSSWKGSDVGGCGTWAVTQCNRQLGRISANTPVSKTEWNTTAAAVNGEDGASSTNDLAKYYKQRGYCVEVKTFRGTSADYAQLAARLQKRCDEKFTFHSVNWLRQRSNGHVETVVGASGNSATTNSWGAPAAVSGGTGRNFRHSDSNGIGKSYGRWSTLVTLISVCPCGEFSSSAPPP